eukprot:TRINITY_DN5575_c0_g2_i4.p1 TRINITY_DN5575_c0_g2~~TRINITY_DN5575_c0_g2_i4.p1  ORF type:complete len:260 (+),score=38.73 TRINITY_DN5575_c0_g2_i4:151-930(+)
MQSYPMSAVHIIGKILFSRFMAPLLEHPAHSGIFSGPVSRRCGETIAVVGIVLKSLALGLPYPSQALFYSDLSTFTLSRRKQMEAIISDFAVMNMEAPKTPVVSYDKLSLIRDLQFIHRAISLHKHDIETFCKKNAVERNRATSGNPHQPSGQALNKRPSLVINSVNWSLGCTIPTCECQGYRGGEKDRSLSKCSACGHPQSAHSGSNAKLRSNNSFSGQPASIKSGASFQSLPSSSNVEAAIGVDVDRLLDVLGSYEK